MKRLAAGILAVILTLQSFAQIQIVYASDAGQNNAYDDLITQNNSSNEAFSYEQNEDGTCTITKYTGEDTNIEIPSELGGYEVGAIGERAFASCSTLTSVTIPDTVISIGDSAFRKCVSLKNISIPDSVLEFGENAFGQCTSLESITIPKEIVAISSSLFEKCSKLTDVILPDGLIEIGKDAFSACSNLKSIVLPDSIMNIDNRAFSGCSSLEFVRIPKKVKILRESVFWESGLSEIEIPNGVKEIGFGFCYFTKIKHVYIPDSVTTVFGYAFGLDIESVSLPKDTKYNLTTSFVNYNGFLLEEKDMELRPAPVREEDVSPETYEIIFHPSSSGATVSLTSKQVVNGDKVGELPNAERENYTFKGWYTKVFGGTKITADKVVNFKANQRAYAHWEKNNENEDNSEKYPLAKKHFVDCKLYQEKGSSGWGTVGVKFNEKALINEATTYNEDIAKFSIQMSTMAYCDYEQEANADSVEDVFEKLEFDRKNVSYYPDPKGREGVSPCWIANKTILLDGEPTDIFCVVIRGTFQEEWIDNFDSGFGETTHKGFLRAAKHVKSKLDAKLEEAQHRVKIIVTGHSRGAATANLVGKLLDDEAGKYGADKQDIYVYGFASPNVAIMDDETQKKYNNLYSIVNPEDFVTKVLPSKWKYRRYGITYVLPSKTTDCSSKWAGVLAAEINYVNYTKYLESVQELYHKYRSYDRDGYQPYPKGMETVSNYVDEVTRSVQNNNSYYTKDLLTNYFDFNKINIYSSLQSLYTCTLAYFMVGGLEYKVVAGANMLRAFRRWGILGVKTIGYFFVNEAIGYIPKLTPNFSCAHRAEYYLAAMEILDTKELQQPRRILKGIVNCPVDIEIKDSDEKIIGRVIDNTVDETIEDHVQMDIHGDSKTFCIPEGLSYSINFTGNNNGTMDYTLCEVDADTGELGRTYYQEVQIVKGESYTQLIDENRTPDAYELVSEATGDRISASGTYTLENLGQLKVDITVEGVGCADSLGNLTPGDYVTISALTDSNNSFLGWYDENDKFISDSAEYSFSIHNNMKFKAKFTNVVVEASDITFKNESITIEKGSVGYNEAIILPENATNKYIIYQSSNDDIVEVDAFGLLRAKSEGIITLTASTIDGILKTTSTVYVTGDENIPDNGNKEIKVTSIRISQDKASIKNGSAIQLTAEISPSNADNKTLAWTSSDLSVATVDDNGLVTAVGLGQATITATSTDGSNISASCIVTVEKPPADTDDSKPNDRPGGSTGTTYPGGTTIPGGTAPGTTTPGTTTPPSQDENTGNDSNNTDSDKPEPDNELTIKLLYYIVSFDPNGGIKLSRKTMTLLNDDNLGILPKVQRRNHSFSGWYTQKDGGQKVDESTVLNAGTTLYAHWSKVAKPVKTAVSALKSSKTGQIAVSLKKVTDTKGYEIHYSTNKKFTSSSTAKVTSMSTKMTLKNLKKGKTYYIRVRAYKIDSAEKNVYGAYSGIRKIRVKK